MEKDFKFAVEDIQRLDVEEYDENEYCVARMKFLSTRPNSHGLKFSEEVLRRDAKTVLGTWIVAEMLAGDFLTHTPAESIIGIVPKDQDVEFVEADDGYLDAYVDVVLSKRYAKDAYDVFVKDNDRSVSIEFNYSHPEDDEYEVENYVIRGTTILGKTVNPSVPKANITVTRFSEEEADKFFAKVHNNSLTVLKKFVEERKESMAEKNSYKVDKTKEAMSTSSWSEVDKTELRNKIIEAKNASTLVKSVYLKVDEDWSSAPSEKLHYPVMQFEGNTLVYNKNALASAKARAVQNNETSVITKIEKIYKSLGLYDSKGKEDDEKMSKEVAFAAVDLNLMWTKINDELHARNYDWRWYIDGIFEQDNKKFVIIRNDDGDRFRINFSYTEDGLFMDDEMVKVDIEFIETDDIKRFSCPEEFKHLMGEEGEPEEPKDEPDEKDAIIMQKDAEIDELRKELDELKAYKAAIEEKEIAKRVEDILDEVKDYLDDDKYQELRTEGLACGKDEIDAFGNKVKAQCFNAFKKAAKKNADKIFAFSKPIEIQKKDMSTMNVWDRIKENY